MKVSIVTDNLSSNSLGRPYRLAKILSAKYDIEIIGAQFGKSIWQPADTGEFIYKGIPVRFSQLSYLIIPHLLRSISGDIVYVHKPLFMSFIPGIISRYLLSRPLILDIDDWELGISRESYLTLPLFKKIKNCISSFYEYASYWNIFFNEKLIPIADEITVSNSFLQARFGGTLITHGVDTDIFDPQRFNKEELKNKLGLASRQIVAFIGTPRRHKGIEDLISAVSLIDSPDILLLLAGFDQEPYAQQLIELAKNKIGAQRVMIKPQVSLKDLPGLIALTDIIVVPQRDNLATKGQVPAKIFDAMSMAKPIIVTDVSDMPQILDDCGLIANAGDIDGLASKIKLLLKDRDLAGNLGKKARDRCIKEYSFRILRDKLLRIFEKYEAKVYK